MGRVLKIKVAQPYPTRGPIGPVSLNWHMSAKVAIITMM